MNDFPLDEEAAKNFFNHTSKLWIDPEIEDRRVSGKLPKNFSWSRCRILFREDNSKKVEFDDEISWKAICRKSPKTVFEYGQGVHLWELQKILDIKRPTVDGKVVPFVYIEFFDRDMEITFDFHPDGKDENLGQLGRNIINSIQRKLDLRVIGFYQVLSKSLTQIGLWAIPSLIPYPLSKILQQISQNDIPGAKTTLTEFCNADFIKKISTKWWNLEPFDKRKAVFDEALFNHENGKFRASIHTLSPHIEGIITDFLSTQFEVVPFDTSQKIKKFLDFAISNQLDTAPYVFKVMLQSVKEFLQNGPVLKSFKWLEAIDSSFPNRHMVGHGKYDESVYNEENSIKLFLLIESIYNIINNIPENWIKK